MKKFRCPNIRIATPIENRTKLKGPLCFRVMFSRNFKKKNKVYEDGVLYHDGQVLKLYDMDNLQLYSGSHKVIPVSNFGQFFYEIVNQIEFEEFTSGKVFKTTPQIAKITFKRFKAQQEENLQLQDLSQNKIPLNEQFFMDKFLFDVMRPHQIEGLKFMLDCITDKRKKGFFGCILADTMGLGKSLQAISLIWVGVTQIGLKKSIIVAPSSVLENWGNEIKKWVGPRLSYLTANRSQEDVSKTLHYFKNAHEYKVLIISYETLRTVQQEINEVCDLLICDEGHRLKNGGIKTVENISKIMCRRRVILTGTPIQNNLKEFYDCINFVNPGILSDYKHFKNIYEYYIYAIERPDSSSMDKVVGEQRALELQEITKTFILRRTHEILQNMLLPKYEYLIFNTMSQNQIYLYKLLLSQKDYQSMEVITLLRKIITHPNLILTDDSKDIQFLRDQLTDKQSDKFQIIKIIVQDCIKKNDKVVIASQFCQTLDQVEGLLGQMDVLFLRLDGKTPQNQRQGIVDRFNRDLEHPVFLLNSKSGGTGLNIIGANRMICIDIDWNPANDLQLMGRIWRDGQTKSVHIYRLISCGTYEEKILQKQFNKDNLSKNIIDEQIGKRKSFNNDLAILFQFNGNDKCMLYKNDNDIKEVISDKKYEYPQELEKYTVLVKVKKDLLKEQNEFNDKNLFTSSKKVVQEEDEIPELVKGQLYNKRSLNKRILGQSQSQEMDQLMLEWGKSLTLENEQMSEQSQEERRRQQLIDLDFQRRINEIVESKEEESDGDQQTHSQE